MNKDIKNLPADGDAHDVSEMEASVNRLAELDRMAPAGMQVRIAAAAMLAARNAAPVVAGRVPAAHGASRQGFTRSRQWAMAATLLIGFGVGFSLLSRLSQPTPTVIDSTAADAALAQEDMESWLTLTEATDETFTSAVKQLTSDTSRVSESVTSLTMISLDGDSL